MKESYHRALTILSIGGAFTGIVITLAGLISMTDHRVIAYLLYLVFIGLYGYGIWAGIRFSEDSADLKPLRVYYLMQVPWISSPILSYRFTSGFHVTAGIIGSNVQCFFRIGSEWNLNFLQVFPWGIGLNAFALAVLIFLKRASRPNQSLEPTGLAVTPSGAEAAPTKPVAHH